MGATVQTERFVGRKRTSGANSLSQADLERVARLLNVSPSAIPRLPRGAGISYSLVLVTSEGIPGGASAKKAKARKKK